MCNTRCNTKLSDANWVKIYSFLRTRKDIYVGD
ncbi:MAG: hypothetical protein BECKG1743D_GA0114223_1005110, partial [Candidatus Kentron sp. G]